MSLIRRNRFILAVGFLRWQSTLTMKRGTVVGALGATLMVGVTLWWLFGSGLSEATAYRLSVDQLLDYATKEGINLDQYNAPSVGWQDGQRLYSFKWTRKDDSQNAILVTVDAMTVDISVIRLPLQGN